MMKLTDQTAQLLSNTINIRNLSVIASNNRGRTSLTDSIIAKGNIISRYTAEDYFSNPQKDKTKRDTTIRSTGVSLGYEHSNSQKYLINLIDVPANPDYSSEVMAALRVSDGALVVVDSAEGIDAQAETILRQAIAEKIRPVLMINKIDRNILELHENAEAIYQSFVKVIDAVNTVVGIYEYSDMGDLSLNPGLGNVAFGSGKDGWGFSLRKFASLNASKFGLSEEKLMEKLWGEHYYDRDTNKWTTSAVSESGKSLPRGFVEFVMEPILKLTKTILEGDNEQIDKAVAQVGVQLTKQDKELTGKALLRAVFSKWLSCADCLLEMLVTHLPSPKVAQAYRCARLYEGPQDDVCAQAIKSCNSQGPLMIYVSKMVPVADEGRFYAFGRVFSGTVMPGQKVRIMGANYTPGSKEDLAVKSIQRAGYLIGRDFEAMTEVPCGNTVYLEGVDQMLRKTGTISDNEDAHNIRTMKYSVLPVVRVSVEVKKASDVPKLVEGLKKLAKSDPLVQVSEEAGYYTVAGSGELHIETCLEDLQEEYAQCEIVKSQLMVTYKETIANQSSQICMAKTTDSRIKLYCSAEPLSEELCELIEKKQIGPETDPKKRTELLQEEFGWEKEDADRIWAFGPEGVGANVLVDKTKGVQFTNEIKDSIKLAFQRATKIGVLTDENMQKVRFNIMDVEIHSDAVQTDADKIVTAGRRVYYASVLTAQPGMQEPAFLVEITTPASTINSVIQSITQRRGQFFDVEPVESSTSMNLVKGYLPVAESFGFTRQLKELTKGKAFSQIVFSNWSDVSGDIQDTHSRLSNLVISLRTRKGMLEQIPDLSRYLDNP